MLMGFLRRLLHPAAGRPRRRRSRLTGCLLWILALIVTLIILSVLFGGFQKGSKVGFGAPPPPLLIAGR
jgi:hypothetical protein